ncbi:hypothetical protein BDR05DRAFT_668525 [Suillus weaverae]|nr:hypothetical protein BDR05DRAFT_668525 [Suillus weaverae]
MSVSKATKYSNIKSESQLLTTNHDVHNAIDDALVVRNFGRALRQAVHMIRHSWSRYTQAQHIPDQNIRRGPFLAMLMKKRQWIVHNGSGYHPVNPRAWKG